MTSVYHREILNEIKLKSGNPTQHTFLDSYLGTDHPRYPINAPTLRAIAKTWAAAHREMSVKDFQKLLTSLIKGKSATEKSMAGILMDAASKVQRKLDPTLFDEWLEYLVGWAEIDSVCTGKYATTEIAANWTLWKKLLLRFSKSPNINKRRASLVLLCSPLRHSDDTRLAGMAFENIERLKGEKEIIITRAISWLLRSMIKLHRKAVENYLAKNKSTLPKIAVRETMTVLKTGVKNKRKGGNQLTVDKGQLTM